MIDSICIHCKKPFQTTEGMPNACPICLNKYYNNNLDGTSELKP